jgi:Zn-finger nucleic acid-binding protein
MKCPVCKETDLVMTERQGVEIDYCPKCRGVWLDRGELDKIIERSGGLGVASSAPPPPTQYQQHPGSGSYGHPGDHHGYQGGHYRKKSWLGELFD